MYFVLKYLHNSDIFLHNSYLLEVFVKYTEYKETKKHGTDEFPLQYYCVDFKHPQYIMPLHWHGETEIIRINEGRLNLWLNNEKHELSQGDVIFVEGGTLHRGEPENCRYECVVFDPRLVSGQRNSRIAELVRRFCSGRAGLAPYCTAANGIANQLIDTVRAADMFYELKAASLVCELVRLFYTEDAMSTEQSSDKRSSHRRAMITVLLEKIETDYAERIALCDLAALVGVNEKYLCRFFKEFTGYTPTDYINRVRVERACYEMKFNRKNVTEAAYECGFNEISYFSKCFKKYKGVSPGKYK